MSISRFNDDTKQNDIADFATIKQKERLYGRLSFSSLMLAVAVFITAGLLHPGDGYENALLIKVCDFMFYLAGPLLTALFAWFGRRSVRFTLNHEEQSVSYIEMVLRRAEDVGIDRSWALKRIADVKAARNGYHFLQHELHEISSNLDQKREEKDREDKRLKAIEKKQQLDNEVAKAHVSTV